MKKEGFIETLKKAGYRIQERELGGGFINDVSLVIAKRGDDVHEYVLKKYDSDKDFNSSLRGYDLVSSRVRTPTIVYSNPQNREVVYDYVEGKNLKSMIDRRDPQTKEALVKLAQTLQTLHGSKSYNPHYDKGDSPDEKNMRKKLAGIANKDILSRKEIDVLQKEITRYIPKNKSIIHGDAHLGNFMFVDGEIYVLDADDAKISDFHADLGKVSYAITKARHEGAISKQEEKDLEKQFLEIYQGEEREGVDLHRMRTPLIEAKHGLVPKELTHPKLEVARGLEKKVAVWIGGLLLGSILFSSSNITGNSILSLGGNDPKILGTILLVLGVSLIFFGTKK